MMILSSRRRASERSKFRESFGERPRALPIELQQVLSKFTSYRISVRLDLRGGRSVYVTSWSLYWSGWRTARAFVFVSIFVCIYMKSRIIVKGVLNLSRT